MNGRPAPRNFGDRLPEEGELFGRVLESLDGEHFMVKCTDGLTRRGRIRGKLKRRVWIRDNDIVIIAPWDFKGEEMCDIVWRFALPQAEWLKKDVHPCPGHGLAVGFALPQAEWLKKEHFIPWDF